MTVDAPRPLSGGTHIAFLLFPVIRTAASPLRARTSLTATAEHYISFGGHEMFSVKFFRSLAVVALILCSSQAFSQQAAQHQGSIEKFTANLSRAGFGVAKGSMAQMDPAQLCCEGISWGMHFNKLTPYIAVKIPPIETSLPVFQLRPDEAVVVIGVTPPEADYFGYQLHLGERTFPHGRGDVLRTAQGSSCQRGGCRQPAHHQDDWTGPIQSAGGVHLHARPEHRSPGSRRPAKRRLSRRDYQHRRGSGPDAEPRPGPEAERLAADYSSHKDVRGPGWRRKHVAAFSGPQPPLRAFRITPAGGASPRLHQTPALRIRGTGRTEMDLTPSLGQLRQAILKSFSGA
ncbi:MAG: hypothetical protein MZV64_42710 [Ignavibacteriales bacterium]|nr:hypothetical protein [Ignavibacteriales bacterium]